MPYEFELDREGGTWTAYNPDGQEIASGELPLLGPERATAILDDHGVPEKTRNALQAIYNKDWEDTEV